LSELAKRVLVGVPAAALFIWLLWLGGAAFQITILAILLLTVWEVHRMMQHTGYGDYFPISLIFVLLLWNPPFIPLWLNLSISSAVTLITVAAVLSRKSESSVRWLTTLFTGVYPTVGFVMLLNIREMGTTIEGFWLTMTLMLMIWGNDIFAYFGGKTFGKHKLAPKISPKKTWEGFGFGFLGAAVGFLIVYYSSSSYPLALTALFPAVVIVSILGPLGDITASRIKRIAGVKDSSSILPGHGGFFDRFDSMILTAPFIFFYFYALL
jgi:phosphatidate cytidylyltransferase